MHTSHKVKVLIDRHSGHLHTAIAGLALVGLFVFAAWWFNPLHIPNNFAGIGRVADLGLFIIVSYVIWHPLLMTVFSWAVTSNIKKVTKQRPQEGLRVAFITNFVPGSESIDLLKTTLPAMVAVNYEHDTWLLDEGDHPEAKRLCKKYGVKYFTRFGQPNYNTVEGKFARKTKGGNHNAWYDSHGNHYDIVAQIDTDFVPKKNFLTKTLGHFSDPQVGFVGTPQVYGNVKDSIIARGAAEQTYNFYGPILRGFHGMGMNMLIGANHVIRVSALKDVGHYSAHITEDLLTGMKLHAGGWKSVYVPEVLAVGEGPVTWQSFFNQQMRWAYGCMHILFHHSPTLFKRMNWRQKAYYYFLQQHYFSGLTMALSTVGLVLYFVVGLQTTNVEIVPFLSRYLPAVAICGLMALWMQRFNIRPSEEKGALWAGMLVSVASWPVYLLAFIGVLRGKRLSYKVTPKGVQGQLSENSLKLFYPHFVIGAISLGCLLLAFVPGRDSIIMIIWAAISTILMLFVPFFQVVFIRTNQLRAFASQLVVRSVLLSKKATHRFM
jgi:cellulose synthase (UDP-forming)